MIMSAEDVIEIHTKLVHWVADTAPADWRRVEINMEMLFDGQEIAKSWITRCYIGTAEEKIEDYPATGLQKVQMLDLFKKLNNASAESGERWTVCDFTVYNDGKYNLEYQYTPPPRLSGDILAGSQ